MMKIKKKMRSKRKEERGKRKETYYKYMHI